MLRMGTLVCVALVVARCVPAIHSGMPGHSCRLDVDCQEVLLCQEGKCVHRRCDTFQECDLACPKGSVVRRGPAAVSRDNGPVPPHTSSVGRGESFAPGLHSSSAPPSPSEVRIGAGRTAGTSCTVSDVRKVLMGRLKEIRYCYDLQRQQAPILAGHVILKWTIGLTGKVSGVEEMRNSTCERQLSECLSRAILQTQFDVPDGQACRVAIPFHVWSRSARGWGNGCEAQELAHELEMAELGTGSEGGRVPGKTAAVHPIVEAGPDGPHRQPNDTTGAPDRARAGADFNYSVRSKVSEPRDIEGIESLGPNPAVACEKGGVLHGTYTGWYSDKRLMTQLLYVEGKRHGPASYWHRNGQLAAKVTYRNDMLHGRLSAWNRIGQKVVDSCFTMGEQFTCPAHGEGVYSEETLSGVDNVLGFRRCSDVREDGRAGEQGTAGSVTSPRSTRKSSPKPKRDPRERKHKSVDKHSVTREAKLAKRPSLRYHDEIMKLGIQGRVFVLVFIDEEGRVFGVKLEAGLHPALDKVAIETACELEFEPALSRGLPVSVEVMVPFLFDLE